MKPFSVIDAVCSRSMKLSRRPIVALIFLCTACVSHAQTSSTQSTNAPKNPPLSTVQGSILVDAAGTEIPFDRRLLGTNAPAWIGPKKLDDPAFQKRVIDLGTTLIRMPGGSWSSSYDWLACETGDAKGCDFPTAAKPSDYVKFLAATGIAGMWTTNFNETAQQAAALVAFFNGAADSTALIGVDRNGIDWGTVGKWATLRARGGHVVPQRVAYWEIGNEVYGAKAAAGAGCASFGWEDVWTCNGSKYISGDAQHDGYLAIRKAMRSVDPSILVGAVGIGGHQSDWDNFGLDVIKGADGDVDFYIVHDYGFNSRPSTDAVLRRPEATWPDTTRGPRSALDDVNPTRSVPIAVTEYNLFAFADGDTSAMMSHAVDGLYIADTIGQMASQGVKIANQWNLVNGANSSGSDYGLFDPDSSQPMPQFFGLAMWSRFADSFIPSTSGFDSASILSAYAGRSADGRITLLVINKAETSTVATVQLENSAIVFQGTADVAQASSRDATSMSYNGSKVADGSLASHPGQPITIAAGTGIAHTFPGTSITLITLLPKPA